MSYFPEALSSFLTFRYLVDPNFRWDEEVEPPSWPSAVGETQTPVSNADEVIEFFDDRLEIAADTGILLSGGIDSAILASYLPEGAPAYTIRFVAEGALDETDMARVYAERFNLDWRIVEVTWRDYLEQSDRLMHHKRAPMHAIEVALNKAARVAKADGVRELIVGNGADSTFGGMDKLLSKNWSFDDFLERYTFVEPADALAEPVSMREYYEPFRKGRGVDLQAFLKTIHGRGIIQTFETSIEAAGCEVVAPYERLRYDDALDIERIRSGDTKYVLRDVFRKRVSGISVPEKIPFSRPMDVWLADWSGPMRKEFKPGLDIDYFSGEQRWLLWCLESFLELMDRESL